MGKRQRRRERERGAFTPDECPRAFGGQVDSPNLRWAKRFNLICRLFWAILIGGIAGLYMFVTRHNAG